MRKRQDLASQVFGRWRVVEFSSTKRNNVYWKCICECGTEREVSGAHLQKGLTRSCGCYRDEIAKIQATAQYEAGTLVGPSTNPDTFGEWFDKFINQKKRIDNKSGFRGVYWVTRKKRWVASITVDKKQIVLGQFEDVRDAARARIYGEIEYYGRVVSRIDED